MSSVKESMYDLWKTTGGTPAQIETVEAWCMRSDAPTDYARATVVIGQSGIPLERVVDCLAAIQHSEQSHEFGIQHAAELLAHGNALFGIDDEIQARQILRFARQVMGAVA